MYLRGRARVDRNRPQALAICDRCGFEFNHVDLSWQFDWRGPNLANLRILVCNACLDKPQLNGQRTIILPPDPDPIKNARPEQRVVQENPFSTVGLTLTSNVSAGANFGTMTGGGGINAAFDSNVNKPWFMCAYISVSHSSFGNYVAKNWAPYAGGITTPASLSAPVQTHTLSSFTAYAPNDRSFVSSGPTTWVMQGSNNSVSWTTLLTGTTAGTAGESVSGEPSGSPYQFHRFALMGDGVTTIAVAQVSFSVGDLA